MPIALFLPYLANTGGWFLAEFGRQPWLVYNLQTLEEGVSTVVPASSIVISLVGLVLIYTLLMIADIYLLAAGARKSPELLGAPEGKEGSLWT
jgi:cytochrome d ubiquinol oxidase subunit I